MNSQSASGPLGIPFVLFLLVCLFTQHADAIEKQPVRFVVYSGEFFDSSSPEVQKASGDTEIAIWVKPDFGAKGIELLKQFFSNKALYITNREQLIKEQTARLQKVFYESLRLRRERDSAGSAAVAEVITADDQFFIEKGGFVYGRDKIVATDVVADQKKAKSLDWPVAYVKTPPKQMQAAIGIYPTEKLLDASPVMKTILSRRNRIAAEATANGFIDDWLIEKAPGQGIKGEQLKELKDSMVVTLRPNWVQVRNLDDCYEQALSLAGEKVAKENGLDLIVVQSCVAAKPDLLSKATVDVTQQMLSALESTRVPIGDKSLTGATSQYAIDEFEASFTSLQRLDGENAAAHAINALNDIGQPGAKTPFGAFTVLLAYCGYKEAGKDAEATAMLQQAEEFCDKTAWPYPIVSFLAKKKSAQELLSDAKSRDQQIHANFYILVELSLDTRKYQHPSAFYGLAKGDSNFLHNSYFLFLDVLERSITAKTQSQER